MKKLISSTLALALAITLCVGAASPALAYEAGEAQAKADALNVLGLFLGTDNGYELEKPLTRMEALILLLRLTGRETEALYGGEWSHPYTDGPLWEDGSQYIGYAYENGLTQGVTDTLFDPQAPASAQTYVTYLLRALGYQDGEQGAVWDNWEVLAAKAGLPTDGLDADTFLRGDAVILSYAALDCLVQEGGTTLAGKLANDLVFSDLALATARSITGMAITEKSSLLDMAGAVYAGVDTVMVSRLMATPIDAENMQYFLGTDAIDIVEGIACEPMMTSTAHSVCIVRVKEGADIEKAKRDIRENVDPVKWVCVGVSEENIRVESHGDLILLVMDNNAPDALTANFLAMAELLQ